MATTQVGQIEYQVPSDPPTRRCDMSGYVLWGYHPDYCGGEPIKLAGSSFLGSLRSESSWRKGGGWTTAIYRSGAEPKGLRIQAEVARR